MAFVCADSYGIPLMLSPAEQNKICMDATMAKLVFQVMGNDRSLPHPLTIEAGSWEDISSKFPYVLEGDVVSFLQQCEYLQTQHL